MKNFKNIKSFEDLKAQYKGLLKINHPDNGGDVAKMQEINVEYDALFKIWKNRHETQTGETVTETADDTRREFYTQFGWEGSNHDWDRSLKEVAQIIRTYVKEKYPTCKFSIRTHYASMCQELHVDIKEFPEKMYKTGDDLRTEGINETIRTTSYTTGEPLEYEHYKPEVEEMYRRLRTNGLFDSDCWTDEELIQAYEKALAKSPFYYGIKTEYFESVIDDVNALVNSYNYEDCDGQIDYFHVDFYFFGVDYRDCQFVPKTARIKNASTKPARTRKTPAKEKTQEIEKKSGYTYKITQGEDTRDGSILWVVRIEETLDKAAYTAENNRMKSLGGYYSKFKHGFIFRFDPTEKIAR
ncbi:MAG: molecular chaperone DnaJ [Lachnospiraceae bacterium]|nr:molecular chaperone DnaJ [Lachnospiraceae bacterium]